MTVCCCWQSEPSRNWLQQLARNQAHQEQLPSVVYMVGASVNTLLPLNRMPTKK